MSVPETTKQWTVEGRDGFASLKLNESAPIPKLGDKEVLVKLQGASLNYRDLIIPKGKYPFPTSPSVVPGSDGAGTVAAVGAQVTRFKPGDKVLTLFNQGHLGGPLTNEALATGLGGALDGTFRAHGAFDESGLVAMPANLDFVEASTLCCAGLTAWNALHGLADKAVQPGQWVVTQGTGGVALFGVQIAKAAGARVIATTGSDDKAATLTRLGADHVLNYKANPAWGEEAKRLTGGRGADHVLEVAGPSSMWQSLEAVAVDGTISIIGFLGGARADKGEPGFLNCLSKVCTVRGILVGSRVQLEDLCRAVEANGDKMRPVVDEKQVFSLDALKDAYEFMWAQKHVGKVCIRID